MQMKHLQHKHNGRITTVHSIGHETYRKVATWHFVADVEWRDGKVSKRTQVQPWAVCYDSSNAAAHVECVTLMDRLGDYLAYHGKWHEAKHMRDGRVVHWTPARPVGELILD